MGVVCCPTTLMCGGGVKTDNRFWKTPNGREVYSFVPSLSSLTEPHYLTQSLSPGHRIEARVVNYEWRSEGS